MVYFNRHTRIFHSSHHHKWWIIFLLIFKIAKFMQKLFFLSFSFFVRIFRGCTEKFEMFFHQISSRIFSSFIRFLAEISHGVCLQFVRYCFMFFWIYWLLAFCKARACYELYSFGEQWLNVKGDVKLLNAWIEMEIVVLWVELWIEFYVIYFKEYFT